MSTQTLIFGQDNSLRISRMSSIPRCDAASISITSSEVPLAIVTQGLQTLSGVGVGPWRTVEAFREDSRQRCLAGAARAREKVGLAPGRT